jgi:hypothetical protein
VVTFAANSYKLGGESNGFCDTDLLIIDDVNMNTDRMGVQNSRAGKFIWRWHGALGNKTTGYSWTGIWIHRQF